MYARHCRLQASSCPILLCVLNSTRAAHCCCCCCCCCYCRQYATSLHTSATAAQHDYNACTCRVAWPAVMKGWEQWRDVYSAEGQLLFAGLRAKVSVFHGQMTRIVPHTTTGLSCHYCSLQSLQAWHQYLLGLSSCGNCVKSAPTRACKRLQAYCNVM